MDPMKTIKMLFAAVLERSIISVGEPFANTVNLTS